MAAAIKWITLIAVYCPQYISPPATPPSSARGIIFQSSREQLPTATLKAAARQANVLFLHSKCWTQTAPTCWPKEEGKDEHQTYRRPHLLRSRNRNAVVSEKWSRSLSHRTHSELYEVPRHQTLKLQGDCAEQKKKQKLFWVMLWAVLNVSDPDMWRVGGNEPKCFDFTGKGLRR